MEKELIAPASGEKVVFNETIGPQQDEHVGIGSILDINSSHHLHRRLNNRQVQLFAIGGTIGTAIFVAMGQGLAVSGAGSLLLAYMFYACIVSLVTNCAAEMTIFMPVHAAFIRQADKWIDEAWGFMVGWNYFFYIAIGIPLEITSMSLIVQFWTDKIPVAAMIVMCMLAYM